MRLRDSMRIPLNFHGHIVSNVYSRSRPAPGGDLLYVSVRLWFEVLLYVIHLPILLPTTYCLAAGIAGGWHLLSEYS